MPLSLIDLIKIIGTWGQIIANIFSFLANIFTIVASGIAIYLFIFKRKSISSALKILVNYARQISFSELHSKLEKLNELNANDSGDQIEAVNILHDIVGQIDGNRHFKAAFANVHKKAQKIIKKPGEFSEPRKRAFVSEFRESIRQYDVTVMDQGGESHYE